MRRFLATTLSAVCLTFTVQAQEAKDIQKELQTQFIMAEDGDTIRIPAGLYTSQASISMDEKKHIVVMGAGMDQTIISFKQQDEGAEGLRFANCENIIIQDLTVQDAKGDCIKVMDTKGISFIRVKAEWTGKPKTSNGAYGLYPVQSERVLIDECVAIGSSDAGIYVGQSHDIVVRNTEAYHNVAGIEIENSTMADVYNCHAHHNTGGLLVFDLPNLPKGKGGNVRLYDNLVENNNYKNFAEPGNTVAKIPPGTGVMVLATSGVEVFNNQIKGNRTAQMSIVSYHMTETPITDPKYDPYPKAIFVHDNTYVAAEKGIKTNSRIGKLLKWKLKLNKDLPEIMYDGILDPEAIGENGQYKTEYTVCIQEGEGINVVNLDADNGFKNMNRNATASFNCEHEALAAPPLSKAN
ncbi:parallel beta-helix domain-containing protein [Pontibacter sp. G13]|uniref:parallel beta-helix domain-containing protein n=1 Tax=Pontibacter sp. G13 TaxID=3074898 RepID=UPI00288936B9|nr:parallel beta-helix domain-containing protein [Pontibacter sp. G13]WNJ16692.1 parallel beta-helix domain-containing protein [Pontibacter sp. G13]